MKLPRLLPLLFALLVLPLGAHAQTRTVTDMAGRKVTVPAQIRKIYCMNPACAMMIYTLAPERLMSWSLQLSEKQRSYLVAPYNKLYGMGPMAGGGGGQNNPGGSSGTQTNVEQLMKMQPDIVMALTDPTDRSSAEQLDKLHERTNLPAYMIDMRLKSIPEVYENLGALLGVQKRAALLAKYCRDTLDEVNAKAANLPESKRPRVYYASGPDGLQTLFDGAPHAEPIPYGGGYNVARTGGNRPSAPQNGQPPQSHIAMAQSRGQVSIEQLLTWNPSVILVAPETNAVGDRFFKQTIWNDPLWKTLPAVRNHKVYLIPSYPFGWVSPPASINRILGVKWTASLLHPELFRYDMRKETRQFYALFFYKNLTEAQLDELLRP